jgi:hypothetical protein
MTLVNDKVVIREVLTPDFAGRYSIKNSIINLNNITSIELYIQDSEYTWIENFNYVAEYSLEKFSEDFYIKLIIKSNDNILYELDRPIIFFKIPDIKIEELKSLIQYDIVDYNHLKTMLQNILIDYNKAFEQIFKAI